MTDEELPNGTGEKKESADSNYLDTIKILKDQQTADKATIEKLKADNKRLVNDFVNGQKDDVAQEVIPTQEEIAKLRESLFGPNAENNNLESAKKYLELREAVIKANGYDPFVPVSSQQNPTPANYEVADRVATVLKECIEIANGSNEVFTAELMRRTK